MAFTAVHPHPTSGSVRGTASRSLKGWVGMRADALTSYQNQTRGKRLCQGTGACPCFSFPLSLKGPESLPRVPRGGKGDQGGEGSLPIPQYQTRGSSWRRRANCSLCFYLPLSLKGPKGEGDKGGEGSLPRPLRHAKSPEIPSGVIQSNQLRVQSTFNQRSIKTPPPTESPTPSAYPPAVAATSQAGAAGTPPSDLPLYAPPHPAPCPSSASDPT